MTAAATLADRISITRNPDGAIFVEATAPLPLYGDETYDGIIFDGYLGTKLWCGASWRIGNGERTSIRPCQFCTPEEAEQFLVALATLALNANGVTAA